MKKFTHFHTLVTVLLTVVLVLFAPAAIADIPQSINYQGLVTDRSTGEPISGPVDLTIRIYSCEFCTHAEDILWSETYVAVPLNNGLFNLILNDVPDTAFTKPSRWLGITVNTDPELTPRTKFTSVPYSYLAGKADTAIALAQDIYIDEAGDDLTGHLNLGPGGIGGSVEVGFDYGNIRLRNNGNATAEVYGEMALA